MIDLSLQRYFCKRRFCIAAAACVSSVPRASGLPRPLAVPIRIWQLFRDRFLSLNPEPITKKGLKEANLELLQRVFVINVF